MTDVLFRDNPVKPSELWDFGKCLHKIKLIDTQNYHKGDSVCKVKSRKVHTLHVSPEHFRLGICPLSLVHKIIILQYWYFCKRFLPRFQDIESRHYFIRVLNVYKNTLIKEVILVFTNHIVDRVSGTGFCL